jgi:hypothetical protein
MQGLKALSAEEALVSGLAVFAKARDLHKLPPKPGETLQQLGIGPSNLDAPIRAWINAKFRAPNGWPLFASGDLKVDMKWSDFTKKVLTSDAKAVKALKTIDVDAKAKPADATKTKASAKSKAKVKSAKTDKPAKRVAKVKA